MCGKWIVVGVRIDDDVIKVCFVLVVGGIYEFFCLCWNDKDGVCVKMFLRV